MIKVIDKPEEPPRISVRFANTVFVLGCLLSILIAIYAIYRGYTLSITNSFYLICILFSGISATLFGLGLRLKNNLKVNLSLILSVALIMTYMFELYLMFSLPDKRTKIEIIEDFRKNGVDAYLQIFPEVLINDPLTQNGFKTKKGNIFPLGAISNVTTILKNEHGFHPIIENDEHGFNNPKGLYKEKEVNIVMTGDSFAEGNSVYADDNIQSILRKLGYKVLSIGMSGNGPLVELASIKEYAEFIKPKVLLWFYFENDITENLKNEKKSSFLMQYLNDENFSQNLLTRQNEIDFVLKKYLNNHEIEYRKKQKKPRITFISQSIINLIKLYELRKRLNMSPTLSTVSFLPHYWIPTPTTPKKDFKKILEKAKKLVSSWGGEMYFVEIPWRTSFKNPTRHPLSEFVIESAHELEIPVIDLYTELSSNHPDPFFLYADHFTVEGYKLVAKIIAKRLNKDGIISSDLNN